MVFRILHTFRSPLVSLLPTIFIKILGVPHGTDFVVAFVALWIMLHNNHPKLFHGSVSDDVFGHWESCSSCSSNLSCCKPSECNSVWLEAFINLNKLSRHLSKLLEGLNKLQQQKVTKLQLQRQQFMELQLQRQQLMELQLQRQRVAEGEEQWRKLAKDDGKIIANEKATLVSSAKDERKVAQEEISGEPKEVEAEEQLISSLSILPKEKVELENSKDATSSGEAVDQFKQLEEQYLNNCIFFCVELMQMSHVFCFFFYSNHAQRRR